MDAVQRVKNMVRHSLIASPNVTNQELYDRAREIAPQAVEGLSLRQFHARFRLPVMVHEMGPRRKRSKAGEKGTTRGSRSDPAKAQAGTRKPRRTRSRETADAAQALQSEVRDVLVEFAVKLEKAESRSDLVRLMGGVDDFAARILQIAQGNGKAAPAKKPKEEPESRPSTNAPTGVTRSETSVSRTAA